MSSGLHFVSGVPLAGSLSLTASDIDTSNTGLRLSANRYLGIYKASGNPDAGDSPDWTRLILIRPFELGGPQLFVYDGVTFTRVTADVDLTQAPPNVLPVNAIYAGSPYTLGQIIQIVSTIDGPRAAWVDIPPPYPIGANGTVPFSDGAVIAFRFIQGIDIRSAAAGANIYPLISNGSGGASFAKLPPAAIVNPIGADPVNLMVSRSNGDYASTILNLIELRADTDLIGTHVPVGYVPHAIADGNIEWVAPSALFIPYYQSPSPVPLSSVPGITLGHYYIQQLDTITWTTQKPQVINVYLECTSNDNGYLVGDRIAIDNLMASDGTRAASFRAFYSGLSCTIHCIMYGIYAQDITSLSGLISLVLLTNTKWQFIVTTQKI